jgi:hypothetical protein
MSDPYRKHLKDILFILKNNPELYDVQVWHKGISEELQKQIFKDFQRLLPKIRFYFNPFSCRMEYCMRVKKYGVKSARVALITKEPLYYFNIYVD